MSCTKQTSKRYTERKSPPYKAEECPGDSKKGNDGLMYISKKNSKGVFRWSKKSSEKAKKDCKPGQIRNPETGRCKKAPAPCKPGQIRNPKTGRCKKVSSRKSKSKSSPRSSPGINSSKAFMHDTMKYDGNEILNAMRDVISKNGGSATLARMIKDMPKSGHFPEVEHKTKDTEKFVKIILKDYNDYLTQAGIYFINKKFTDLNSISKSKSSSSSDKISLFHENMQYNGNDVLNSMRDVIRAHGGSATLSQMNKEMSKSGHFPIGKTTIALQKDFVKFIMTEYVDYLGEGGINFENNKFVDVS